MLTNTATYTRGVISTIAVYDADLHTGRQEDDRHCDAEVSGVILLKFSHYLYCSAGGECIFVKRPTH